LVPLAILVALPLIDQVPDSANAVVEKYRSKGTYFNHKGHKIFYYKKLNPDAKGNVVFLHGFPTSSYDWKPYFESSELSSQYNLLTLDFLGFGLSDKPNMNYTFYDQADIVSALVHKFGWQKVHLVAHDYGNTVAQELITRTLQGCFTLMYCVYKWKEMNYNISSVTYFNGGIIPAANHPLISQKILATPYIGPIVARFLNYYLFKANILSIWGSKKPSEERLQVMWAFVKLNDGHLVFPNILDYIRQRWYNEVRWVDGALFSPHTTENVPVLLLYGPADSVSGKEVTNAFLRKRNINVVYQQLPVDMGHFPNLADPSTMIRYISEFLSSC